MNNSHSIKKNIVLFLFMSIFLIKGIFYAVYITPPLLNTSPDDVGHISYIQYIASEKKLPILYETAFEDSSNKLYKAYGEDQELSSYKDILVHKETFNNKSVNGIAQHPPLYYLLMAPVYLIIKLFTSKLYLIILVLRLATIPFGLASIYFIDKIIDILKGGKILRYCILSCFIFSMPIQYYFSNITNDSLLIFLCILTLYFLLKYTTEKQIKDYILFIVCCALVLMTKYTGALVLISYILYFIYKSIKLDGLKRTSKLLLYGLLLGGIIVAPVFLRNMLLYGNPIETVIENIPLYRISFLNFIKEKGYVTLLYQALLALVGWENLIVADYRIKWITSFVLATLAYLCVLKVINKKIKTIIFYICLMLIYVLSHILSIELNAIISIVSFIIISIYSITTKNIEQQKREMNIFFFSSIIIVFLIFIYEHYQIALHRGFAGAVSGRYYYIIAFPFLYLVFSILEEYRFRHIKPILIVLTSINIMCEIQLIERCFIQW